MLYKEKIIFYIIYFTLGVVLFSAGLLYHEKYFWLSIITISVGTGAIVTMICNFSVDLIMHYWRDKDEKTKRNK